MRAEPTVIAGQLVRLVPLTLGHVDALCECGLDPAIWTWMPMRVRDMNAMSAFVQEALESQRAGAALPFAMMLQETGQVIGSTRFMNIAPAHRRVEIGGTWIAPAWQRTRVNTETKYLMLRHAFEHWNCMRVELKTDARNAVSRAAILRLGAVEEGTFRKHMLLADGSIRDSVYFSIVDDEWPTVKVMLAAKLGQQS
ncbi:MAG: GNAT family N-acetyltransferase [Gemmatimonadaceae bacterium]